MNSRERNAGIDMLKFGAAVFIILGHINERFIAPIPVTGLFGFTDVVELFFLISGYLCRDLSKFNSPNGIIKRILRVYPMIFITTTVAIVLNEFAHLVYEEPSTGILNVLASYLLIFKFSIIPNQLGIDGNLWYIGILIFCYCVAYVVKKIEEKLDIHYLFTSVVLVLIGVSCVFSGENKPFWNYYTGRGLAAFFLGVILWDIINNRIKIEKWWILTIVEANIAIVVVKWMLDINIERIESIWGVECFVLFPAILHIGIKIGSFIKSTVFTVLGDISFEMYIWQAIGFFMIEHINLASGRDSLSFKGILAFYVVLLVWSYIMNRFVEKPLNKTIIQIIAK